MQKQRDTNFALQDHCHGKARVRVLRVRRSSPQHTVQEYEVATKLFSPAYSAVFTQANNTGLVATDTQKNTVYIVAKRSDATTPEDFAIDMCKHLLEQYSMLTAVECDVKETLWQRVYTQGGAHNHGFTKVSPEFATARVRLTRDAPQTPEVVSGVTGLTVLKTTQSGFTNYLHDQYTLLKDTEERCMATEVSAEWRYAPLRNKIDYAAVRRGVIDQLLLGYFGPPKSGVYSPSLQAAMAGATTGSASAVSPHTKPWSTLPRKPSNSQHPVCDHARRCPQAHPNSSQATIYDVGCLVLKAVQDVASISIDTPNLHYLPFQNLSAFGEKFEDDVFIPTSEPSGTIHCSVSRTS
jgi:urate oxidase